jgi:hypothetical protein
MKKILNKIVFWFRRLFEQNHAKLLKSYIWKKDGTIDKKLLKLIISTPYGTAVVSKNIHNIIWNELKYDDNIICEVKSFGFCMDSKKNEIIIWADPKSGDIKKEQLEKLVNNLAEQLNNASNEIMEKLKSKIINLWNIQIKYAKESEI